ncbi:MAG TPA: CoA-binding protein [Patescibacteria group bacterium]|jgi:hypothetical protein|nr:CoA-binding protein [Patescibacteria group bacterium]
MDNSFFKGVKIIAIVGLSDDPNKHSYKVAVYFKSKEFRIIPVNPSVNEVLGEKAYPDLLSIPKTIKIDVVDIFRRPEEVIPHIKEALKRGGITKVWLQEGVSSKEAEDFASKHNLSIISNFCMMEAYKNLPRT